MSPEQIKALIESGIADCEATVEGDGSHFSANVVSAAFEGLSMVKQHQLVYATLGDSMQQDIHALSIQAYTREQWEKARKLQVL